MFKNTVFVSIHAVGFSRSDTKITSHIPQLRAYMLEVGNEQIRNKLENAGEYNTLTECMIVRSCYKFLTYA